MFDHDYAITHAKFCVVISISNEKTSIAFCVCIRLYLEEVIGILIIFVEIKRSLFVWLILFKQWKH